MDKLIQVVGFMYLIFGILWTLSSIEILSSKLKELRIIDVIGMIVFLPYLLILIVVYLFVYICYFVSQTSIWNTLNRKVFK